MSTACIETDPQYKNQRNSRNSKMYAKLTKDSQRTHSAAVLAHILPLLSWREFQKRDRGKMNSVCKMQATGTWKLGWWQFQLYPLSCQSDEWEYLKIVPKISISDSRLLRYFFSFSSKLLHQFTCVQILAAIYSWFLYCYITCSHFIAMYSMHLTNVVTKCYINQCPNFLTQIFSPWFSTCFHHTTTCPVCRTDTDT